MDQERLVDREAIKLLWVVLLVCLCKGNMEHKGEQVEDLKKW